MSRAETPSAFSPATTSGSDTEFSTMARPVPGILLDRGVGARDHHGLAVGEGVGLHHQRRLLDPERQVALGHRHPADPHVGAEDDRPRALVDDHPRLGRGHRPRCSRSAPSAAPARRCRRRRGRAAPCPSRASVAIRAPRSRLIAASIRAAVVKSGFRSASRMSRTWVKSKPTSRSTRAPAGISPAVGTPWVTRLGLALGDDAAGDDRALRHRVDLPVGGVQRRHHQRAAEQARGVADRRDRHVDLARRPARRAAASRSPAPPRRCAPGSARR